MKGLRCENLTKYFGNGENELCAVNGITTEFEQGVFYSIIGKSGSGKTTLLHLLIGLLEPSGGNVCYDGRDLHEYTNIQVEEFRRQTIGIVFQDYQLLPELTVKENILLPMILDERPLDYAWYEILIKSLDLKDKENSFPFQLSGGQQQRVALGRAIINRPEYLFADEPTGNLDRKNSENILEMFLKIKDLYHPMILIVTHDLDLARNADRILQMEDGSLTEVSL